MQIQTQLKESFIYMHETIYFFSSKKVLILHLVRTGDDKVEKGIKQGLKTVNLWAILNGE